MGAAWGLVVIGMILVALASKPFQRARANAAEKLKERQKSQVAARLPQPEPNGPVTHPVTHTAPVDNSESLTPQWLDSLIGSDSAVTNDDPFDDVEGIAAILRLWLAEDSQ